MSTTACRGIFIAAGAAALAVPFAAMAQDDPALVNIMRECGKIDEPAQRFACYDNTFRASEAAKPTLDPRPSAVPQPSNAPVVGSGVSAPVPETAHPPHRSAAPDSALARATLSVAAVVEKAPGTYILTLEDGEQWEFAESMGASYDAPRRGSAVQVQPGTLGSHRMRVDGQQPVRVRRVR
jgi:hypothetical protein